jgi:hypothetical protein
MFAAKRLRALCSLSYCVPFPHVPRVGPEWRIVYFFRDTKAADPDCSPLPCPVRSGPVRSGPVRQDFAAASASPAKYSATRRSWSAACRMPSSGVIAPSNRTWRDCSRKPSEAGILKITVPPPCQDFSGGARSGSTVTLHKSNRSVVISRITYSRSAHYRHFVRGVP